MIPQVIEKMERETGFEPATSSLGSWHSTTELLPPVGESSSWLILNEIGHRRAVSPVSAVYRFTPVRTTKQTTWTG